MANLLEVRDLRTYFATRDGVLKAVDGVSYDVVGGETVALVGESGSGKTISGLSLLRLMPSPHARIVGGEIRLAGRDLLTLTEAEMQRVRGREIAMISQEPMTALNQVLTVGRQIAEPLRLHMGLSEQAARKRAVELLDMVRIPSARQRLDEYPYQFSGGMLQRVMIATALGCGPKVLVADEPTTALDVTIQAQVMELLREITAELGTAVILITHDLGVVARYAGRVNVMYAGRIVESGPAEALYASPAHPYTRGLLASVPQLDRRRSARLSTIEGAPPDLLHLPRGCAFQSRCTFVVDQCREQAPKLTPVEAGHTAACWRATEVVAHPRQRAGGSAREDPALVAGELETIVDVRHLQMHFPVKRGLVFKRQVASVRAVDDVSFAIRRGETLGLVGESGSGKTTVGRSLLKLSEATAGDIYFQGINLRRKPRRAMKPLRRDMQMVFQDPYGSLNARMTVGQIIGEPLWLHDLVRNRKEAQLRVAEILRMVGLDPAMRTRFPHELSGGQRQRIGIARALAVEPDVIVADEPVSALDVSVQAQIINLMEDIQDRLGIAFLFISHDLAVVRHISDRVAVMYLGRIMETADCETLYSAPRHPYTESLLAAVPIADPARERHTRGHVLEGEIPSPMNPPSGCAFRTRCPLATEQCRNHVPPLREVGPGHWVACIHR